ncbi:hypothetical protein KP509_27G042200 [Ceratopteris richardii]|uniref:Protein kinase domain-containing protein n=1 Tax=Ceratopteris richardii TaxID=49495 RepID=A0A8T2RHW3_CERRI|nr:hypothetical protein KP509_27G042200 [Ceratopteris richardii]
MRIVLVLPWLLFCSALLPSGFSTPDGDVLLSIISALGMERPSNWTGDDPCLGNWDGVRCDVNSRVSYLNLTNKGLSGEIPAEIGNLNALINLDLGNLKGQPNRNTITGDLSALSGLSNLQSLNLTFNPLAGGFPTAVLGLTALTDLRLDNCQLTGEIPKGLSKLGSLQYLYLGNNSMTGAVLSEIGSLKNLIELSLWNHTFMSTIAPELSALRNLRYLNLHDCNLFGGLPSEFGNLVNLETMLLYGNSLTGPIPDAWSSMSNLEDLELYKNRLTNTFPSWILNARNLSSVDLSYNYLYGPVPNISSSTLESLNIACNYFSGSAPTSAISSFTDSQNCFNGSTDDNRGFCNSLYKCSEFSKQILDNGLCPTCPPQQSLSNRTTCICLEDSAASSGGGGQASSGKFGKIFGSSGGALLLIIAALCGFWAFRKFRKANKKNEDITDNVRQKFTNYGSQGYWEAPKGVQRFTLEELTKATNGFDFNHEIGSGGFGKVFYGKLGNGKEVAIKRAADSSMQGGTEFRNEVLLLSRLHHRNLVRLEGFCEDNDLQILVYEYVLNGNLHAHLFQRDATSFGWLKRLDIAVGIAQGLDYLHSFADPPVIHRDVKPSNVLLDENLVAKVSDFGISRATKEFETHVSTTPAGTAGYIDPQYFLRRQLTTASDVYGFGVVLLELITGQKAIDPTRLEDHNLVEWVKMKMKVEGIQGIVDRRMCDDCPFSLYETVTNLAIRCASFNKNDRPSMKVRGTNHCTNPVLFICVSIMNCLGSSY